MPEPETTTEEPFKETDPHKQIPADLANILESLRKRGFIQCDSTGQKWRVTEQGVTALNTSTPVVSLKPLGEPPAETAAFVIAYETVEIARKRTDVLAAEIERHLNSLRDGDDVRRTSEMQATLSLEDIEKITDDLVNARDALVAVLAKSGEAEAQSNDEKAKLVTEILDKMEADGEFDGLSEDDTAGERQLLGMRLRADME